MLFVCLITSSPVIFANNNSNVFARPKYSGSASGQASSSSTSSQPDINLTSEILQCYNSSSSALTDKWINQLAHIGKPTFTSDYTLFGALDKSLVHCFSQAKGQIVTSTTKTDTESTHTHTQTQPNKLGLGTFLTPGQFIITGIKYPPLKHSTAYNIGYKLGTIDGEIGSAGLPDGSRACNNGIGINGTTATNQCLAGYFAAWSRYCPMSKYGCNS